MTRKVNLDDCWLFARRLSNQGYAEIRIVIEGKKRVIRVHRIMYESVNGEIPSDKILDHLCRVRHCINPDHLEAVSVRTNTLRGEGPAAENSRKTHCSKGHKFEGYNLLIKKGSGNNIKRVCRTCYNTFQREVARRRYFRLKAAK